MFSLGFTLHISCTGRLTIRIISLTRNLGKIINRSSRTHRCWKKVKFALWSSIAYCLVPRHTWFKFITRPLSANSAAFDCTSVRPCRSEIWLLIYTYIWLFSLWSFACLASVLVYACLARRVVMIHLSGSLSSSLRRLNMRLA